MHRRPPIGSVAMHRNRVPISAVPSPPLCHFFCLVKNYSHQFVYRQSFQVKRDADPTLLDLSA